MLFTILVSLLAVFVSAEVEEIDVAAGCGCGVQKPTCLNPNVHYQNYQDVNVDVVEYYNYISTFPVVGGQDYAWSLIGSGNTLYSNGYFSSDDADTVTLTRNTDLVLEAGQVSYISAKMDFSVSDVSGVSSPLGVDSDPFYGFGFLQAYGNTVTGLQYAFVLTNGTTYALYGRTAEFQSPQNNYNSFLYLVPIMAHQDGSIYTLVFNKDEATVSYMIDGVVRLGIPTSGQLIDSKFLIEPVTGGWPQPAFPHTLQISMGITRFTEGIPNTACQEAIFDYCDRTQSIVLASNVECTYEPIQNFEEWSLTDELVISMFSITQASYMLPACGCACIN